MSLQLKSDAPRNGTKHHGFFKFLVFAAASVFSVFMIYSFVDNNRKVNEYKQQYEELLAQTELTLEENAQISHYLENDENLDEYIESIAREKLDYASPDERIYYVIPSSGG